MILQWSYSSSNVLSVNMEEMGFITYHRQSAEGALTVWPHLFKQSIDFADEFKLNHDHDLDVFVNHMTWTLMWFNLHSSQSCKLTPVCLKSDFSQYFKWFNLSLWFSSLHCPLIFHQLVDVHELSLLQV